MPTFNISVYPQSRVLTGLGLAAVALPGCIAVGVKCNSFFVAFLLYGLFLLTCAIYARGKLRITISGDLMEFQWQPNPLRNHRIIPALRLGEIKSIVIDDKTNLRRIHAAGRSIDLGSYTVQSGDRIELIRRLRGIARKNGIPVENSWERLHHRNVLRLALYANVVVLIFGILAGLTHMLIKGFSPQHLYLLLFIPQMIWSGRMMRAAMRKPPARHSVEETRTA